MEFRKSAREIEELFQKLKEQGYYSDPKTPDQIIKSRENSQTPDNLKGESFTVSCDHTGEYILHSLWPAKPEEAEDFIHFGPESLYLAREIEKYSNVFNGKKVLDLGCSSGILSFTAGKFASLVYGVDSSLPSIEAAKIVGEIRNLSCSFEHFKISAENSISTADFDFAVFNPPLAIPTTNNAFPHRDGGKLGIEIPNLFLDFAHRHLRSSGEAWFIVADPILKSGSAFKPDTSKWKLLERKILDPWFNQSLAKKEDYSSMGIERLELCLFKFKSV